MIAKRANAGNAEFLSGAFIETASMVYDISDGCSSLNTAQTIV